MRVYFEVIFFFSETPRWIKTLLAIFRDARFNTTVYQPKSREPGLKAASPPAGLRLRARLPGATPFIKLEPRPNDVQRKTSVPCRTVPGAVVAWADDSRFSRRRVADANERRNREGTKAVTSVERGALGGARERAR